MDQNGQHCAACAHFVADGQDSEGKWIMGFDDHRNGMCAHSQGAHHSLDELPHDYPACAKFEGRYDPATRACESCLNWKLGPRGCVNSHVRYCHCPKDSNSPVHCKNWWRRTTPLKEASHAGN